MKLITLLLVICSLCFQTNLFAASNHNIGNKNPDSIEVTLIETSNLEIIDQDIVLTWDIKSTKNSKGFQVERSSDREHWLKIGFVKTENGKTHYKFVDNTSFPTSQYYRVKEVKFDSLFEYTKIIVELESVMEGRGFSMSSNPVGNYLMMNNSQGLISIYNAKCELVKRFTIKEESISVDTSDLSKGQYILHIQKENATTISRLIVKN